MVQLRASLEALVLQAWRDRWTEQEWSVNLKAALSQDASEASKLCGLLIRQATLSEVPNKLMFSYLSYTLAAQVVPHTSLLEAVIGYHDFERELCIESILDVINFVRDHFRCDCTDAYQCERMCELLTATVGWMASGVESALAAENANLLSEVAATANAFVSNPFVAVCLYIDGIERPDERAGLLQRLDALAGRTASAGFVADLSKHDVCSLAQRTARLMRAPRRCAQTAAVGGSAARLGAPSSSAAAAAAAAAASVDGAHPSVLSLAALLGVERLADPLDVVAARLCSARAALRLPWWVLLRDLVRGAVLLHMEPGPTLRDAHAAAFLYLKMPRTLRHLMTDGELDDDDLTRALDSISLMHTLFNSLDVKSRINSFSSFVEQLKLLNLISEPSANNWVDVRNRERSTFSASANSTQEMVNLVLRAEKTAGVLEKSFNSPMTERPDHVIKILSHMISRNGRTFESICGANAAMGKLDDFIEKLLLFNGGSCAPGQVVDPQMRATMFDLSFLLLSHAKVLYPAVRTEPRAGGGKQFFQYWTGAFLCRDAPTETEEAARRQRELTERCAPFDADAALAALQQAERPWQKADCDWANVCATIPLLGERLLAGIASGELAQRHLETVLAQLHSDVFSALLGLSQWLFTREPSDARRYLIASILQHLHVCPTPPEEKNHAVQDRWTLMVSSTKALLGSVESSAASQFPWLFSCARRVAPLFGRDEAPLAAHLREAFQFGLRQGFVGAVVLDVVERCGQHNVAFDWCRVWVEELMKLQSVDELSQMADASAALAAVRSCRFAPAFVRLLVDYAFGLGHELFCVAPRGCVLARLLVRVLVQALHERANAQPAAPADEPTPKMRRIGDEPEAANAHDDDLDTALGHMFTRFGEACEDGEVRPAVYFVANFLRTLSEYDCAPSRKLLERMPASLLSRVIRTDPKTVSAASVLALHDLQLRLQRRRAVQNLFLLRQLRAI